MCVKGVLRVRAGFPPPNIMPPPVGGKGENNARKRPTEKSKKRRTGGGGEGIFFTKQRGPKQSRQGTIMPLHGPLLEAFGKNTQTVFSPINRENTFILHVFPQRFSRRNCEERFVRGGDVRMEKRVLFFFFCKTKKRVGETNKKTGPVKTHVRQNPPKW